MGKQGKGREDREHEWKRGRVKDKMVRQGKKVNMKEQILVLLNPPDSHVRYLKRPKERLVGFYRAHL